jgi:hypothetical protein
MALDASRRGFVVGLGAFFIAAPAIVRATSIMPVGALSDDESEALFELLDSPRSSAEIAFLEGMTRRISQAMWHRLSANEFDRYVFREVYV